MNPTGEVVFDAAGKRWTLKFGMAALCAIEDRLNMTTGDAMAELPALNMRVVRTLFVGGLSPAVTVEEAMALSDELGFRRLGALVEEALKLAFPDPADGDGDPQANGGTGSTS